MRSGAARRGATGGEGRRGVGPFPPVAPALVGSGAVTAVVGGGRGISFVELSESGCTPRVVRWRRGFSAELKDRAESDKRSRSTTGCTESKPSVVEAD